MAQSLEHLPRDAIHICTESKSTPAWKVGNSTLGIQMEGLCQLHCNVNGIFVRLTFPDLTVAQHT